MHPFETYQRFWPKLAWVGRIPTKFFQFQLGNTCQPVTQGVLGQSHTWKGKLSMLQGHSNSAKEGISAQESSLIFTYYLFKSFWFSFFFFSPGLTLYQSSDFWAPSQLLPLLLNELKIITIKQTKPKTKQKTPQNNKNQHARTVTSSGRGQLPLLHQRKKRNCCSLHPKHTHAHRGGQETILRKCQTHLEPWPWFRTSVQHSQIYACSQAFHARCYLWKRVN